MSGKASTVDLYYTEQGQGEPLVLIHGFPLDHSIWEPVAGQLKEQARIIMPDLRGHGRSPFGVGEVPDAGYSMDLMARDLARLLDQLALPRAIIVGHSMGGYVALAFTRRYPERVIGLGLVASQAGADTSERAKGRRETAKKVRHDGTLMVAEDMTSKMTTDPALQARLRQLMMKTSPEGMAGALGGMASRPDFTGDLTNYEFPAVVVVGDQDAMIPKEKSEDANHQLCHSRLFVVPGAGHVPMLDNPKATAEALEWLLAEVEIGQSSAP